MKLIPLVAALTLGVSLAACDKAPRTDSAHLNSGASATPAMPASAQTAQPATEPALATPSPATEPAVATTSPATEPALATPSPATSDTASPNTATPAK